MKKVLKKTLGTLFKTATPNTITFKSLGLIATIIVSIMVASTVPCAILSDSSIGLVECSKSMMGMVFLSLGDIVL